MAQEGNDLENSIYATDARADDGSDNGIEENDETEQIREKIEETRSNMGETIDAIQDKLSFSNISEQVSEQVNLAVETAKGVVYDATIGKAANIMKTIGNELSNTQVINTVKRNPLPFALIGVGAGLLAYQAYSGRSRWNTREPRRLYDQERSGSEHSTMENARGRVSGAAEKVTDAAGSVYDKVTGAVGSAYSGTGEVIGQAYDKAGELGTAAREQYETYIEDNPLAVGAVALALGAAVGMALPSTRYEGKLMGTAKQDLIEQAQATAGDLIDRTKEVVSEAVGLTQSTTGGKS